MEVTTIQQAGGLPPRMIRSIRYFSRVGGYTPEYIAKRLSVPLTNVHEVVAETPSKPGVPTGSAHQLPATAARPGERTTDKGPRLADRMAEKLKREGRGDTGVEVGPTTPSTGSPQLPARTQPTGRRQSLKARMVAKLIREGRLPAE